MSIRLDHVVLGVPDLAAATRVLAQAQVVVESGWALDDRPAVRVAGPGSAVLMLLQGDLLELAVTSGPGGGAHGDPDGVFAAGEPYEETWLSPDGERVVVQGRRVREAHTALVGPVSWPEPAQDGGVLTSLSLGAARTAALDALLARLGLPASRVRVDARTAVVDFELVTSGTDGVSLSLSTWPGADPSQLVLHVGLGVPHETGGEHPFAGATVVVSGDARRHRGWPLLVDVAQAYALTPGGGLSWPDPHDAWPEGEAPESAYSKVTDPERYRVVTHRVDAWLAVLQDRGLAEVEEVDPRPYGENGWFVTARVVRGTRAGTVPFTVLTSRFWENARATGPDVVVTFQVGDGVTVEALPDCGCDACDTGSRDLVRGVDERILRFLQGGPLHATAPWGDKTWDLDGWHGTSDVDRLEEAMAAGDPRVEVLQGEPWL